MVNLAVELNGQPPVQVYVKSCREYRIILRSIDLGSTEILSSYEELSDYNKVGSPFSIPKAALALTGFTPEFSGETYPNLESQLRALGGGYSCRFGAWYQFCVSCYCAWCVVGFLRIEMG